ncbi:MauE/DoxX family redox-associated membrane protein [Desulfosarcina sp.]|uniref:MauE/DoxX family redox-associated membrane protein n=1 Tax=Desulfosarcina sp. TaxID=2027861 RepID=UPI0039709F12
MSALTKIHATLTHPYLALILRLYIAGLFIYAGMLKINYTAEFAETIASYRMVPYWGVNLMAVTMPWIELISGILLMCGIRVRSAIVVTGSLLVMFSVGIAANLIWKAPIDCGCFHTLDDPISWKTLVRDLMWVAMAVHVYCYDRILHLERKLDWIVKEI